MTKKSLEELAKSLPVIEKSIQMGFIGGGNGTSADPYTLAEFDSMSDSGNWNGGFVMGLNGEGVLSYVSSDTFNYGSSSYPGHTSQDVLTFPNYVTSLNISALDSFAGWAVGLVDLGITAHMKEKYGDMTRNIQAELLEKGYDGSSSFTIVKTVQNDDTKFSVYDANTGKLITSRTLDFTGSK